MQKPQRLDYLDSIRGMAAFSVVLHHCWLACSEAAWGPVFGSLSGFSLHAGRFIPGRSCVIIFFILSGFVLTLSLKNNPVSYPAFILKRLFRIYPAFLAALLASYLLHAWIGIRHDNHSDWLFKQVVDADLSWDALSRQLTLWVTSRNLDNAMWSLVYEMRISVIFPLILLSISQFREKAIFGYVLLSFVCAQSIFYLTGKPATGYAPENLLTAALTTAYFIVFFALGAFAAIKRQEIAAMVKKLSRSGVMALLIAVAAVLLVPDGSDRLYRSCLMDVLDAAAALTLMALALVKQKMADVLNHKALIWTGRVSYSLYLIHIPIIYLINQTLGSGWSFPRLTLVVLPLSMAAAEILARCVEFPSIKLGKQLSSKLFPVG